MRNLRRAAMPCGEAKRHEPAFDQPLAEKSIDGAKHFRGPVLLRPEAAQRADGDGAVKRRGASLPADVAQRDRQLLRTVAEKIVQVAAQFARRDHARGDIEPEFRPGQTRQQRALNAAGGVEVALHARFVARHLLVEARVFDATRRDARQESKAPARGPA